jgi:cyanophycin synthetase
MEFRKVLALRGPNIWANSPVLEAWVDLKDLKDRPSNSIPGFNDRLLEWLPSLIEHECSEGHRGGFVERLRAGTYMGHVLEHVTLELQTLAGTPVGFGRARETAEEGVSKVVVKYREEELARACLDSAFALLMAAVHDRPVDIGAEVRRLRRLANHVCLGPSTASIVEAARARGIPSRRLNRESLVQLGQGVRQRRIVAAQTDRTSAIAESIAQDKELTKSLLRSIGVPVPEGRPVTDADDAWAAAQEIGAPVVVKPQYGNQGRGVATNLSTREQIARAFDAAKNEGDDVVVERYAPGADYRLLVIGQRLVAAARREPALVVGDGVASIAELVDRINQDPRRGDEHATALSKIPLDAVSLAVLAEQGFTTESVPTAGARVLIRRNANLSTGGTATDVTDRVHPAVAARAVEAARVIGLDIAGVDVVARVIGRPLEDQGGVIVEVNAAPGLRMHLEPSEGVARPVGAAIVDLMFPSGDDGRIPIAAVTGTNGKTTVTRLLAHLVRGTGRTVGMTCTDGIYVNDRRLEAGDCAGPQSAQMILANPAVEAAVLETARGGILRAGLGFDACTVAVVTNIGEGDHLGLADVHDIETLARVKRTVVEVVLPRGYAVLNAADPLVLAMAEHCPGSIIYFAIDGEDSVIRDHRAIGGRAVIVRDGAVVLAEGQSEDTLIDLGDVPLTHGGRIGFQIENALAAAAAGWGLGLGREEIAEGLASFNPEMDRAPARFNVLEIDEVTVIVDYGHNVSALEALIRALGPFPHDRRHVVYTAAGDRRDVDIVRQGELLGDAFDAVYLYEEHSVRGRPEGEITALFRRGIEAGARTQAIHEIRGALRAIGAALRAARPGDLVLIQADLIDETIAFLRQYMAGAARGREIDLDQTLAASLGVGGPVLASPTID